jgi:hypothetical protein
VNGNFVKVDVAEIHHKVLGHKSFKLSTFNNVKLTVVLQTAHQLVDGVFVVVPIFLETLHLHLSFR